MSLYILASFVNEHPYPTPDRESLLRFTVEEDWGKGSALRTLDEFNYAPFGILSNESVKQFLGEPIGVIDTEGYEEAIIFSVNGYSSKEWIIEYLNVFMGGGHMLFKESNVTLIPDELKEFEESV
jgi:hypothetical protein